jgi:hypothetical protein
MDRTRYGPRNRRRIQEGPNRPTPLESQRRAASATSAEGAHLRRLTVAQGEARTSDLVQPVRRTSGGSQARAAGDCARRAFPFEASAARSCKAAKAPGIVTRMGQDRRTWSRRPLPCDRARWPQARRQKAIQTVLLMATSVKSSFLVSGNRLRCIHPERSLTSFRSSRA